jgi:hypothetical protein
VARACRATITGAGHRGRESGCGRPEAPPPHHHPIQGLEVGSQQTRARDSKAFRRAESQALLCATDFYYTHTAGTSALAPVRKALPAAEKIAQPQERLRDALTILTVPRAEERRTGPVSPVSSTGRVRAGRRPGTPVTEVES